MRGVAAAKSQAPRQRVRLLAQSQDHSMATAKKVRFLSEML